MKRLVVFSAIIAVWAISFSIPIFAAELEDLAGDLYISEVASLEEKYVEIYINKKVDSDDYFVMTALADEVPTKALNLGSLSEQLSGSYYLFLDIDDISLTNPNNTRTVYLCKGNESDKNARKSCVTESIDQFTYSGLSKNSENSWSRDFDGVDLTIKESKRTPGEPNDFNINQKDDEDEKEDTNKAVQFCQALVLSEISSIEQWIEIYNKSDLTILPANMVDCQIGIQSGDTKTGGIRNYNYHKISSFLNFSSIDKYEYMVLDLTKTESKNKLLPNSSSIKDRSVIMADNEVDYDYGAIYKSQKEGTSLSYFADGWKVTYLPTPGEENKYQQYQTCEPGKHINEVTGNCVKDVDPPAECPEGQYRNPETGRCKKYPEEKVLAECPEGQYRNPLTNRCKKIASDDDLMPCAEGYERNPETNRCRKIRSTDSAEYAVDPYGENSENYTWAIIGAVGIGVIGLLIALQFRHEIAQGFAKIGKRIKK